MKKVLLASKEVYSKPRYLVLSLIIALALIVFNIAVVNYRLFLGLPSFGVASSVFFGTFSALPLRSVATIILAGVLSGVLVSMLAYHVNTLRSLNNFTGFGGIFLGLAAPACSSCGVGLVAILGGAGFVGSLPFGGLEISVLAIALLGISIYSLSNKIVMKTCGVSK
ncbi:MAG: hypothetical protein Q8R00_01870 [Candidatus Nanoarchaeia archaeon]|nr:hypothetical protein [Candidatus Nanoarchaeia archaeon]